MSTPERLWAVVDLLTKPQQRRLERDPSTWLDEERQTLGLEVYGLVA